jgi:putative ABC transport system permease protein
MVEKSLRETMAAAHHFRPSDHNAMGVANLMTQVKQFRMLSIALSGSAFAGGRAHAGHRRHRPDEHHAGGRAAAHPRDRHREGAGRAPHHILIQFLAEAMAITGVGGVPALRWPTWSPPGGPHHVLQRLAKNAESADIRLLISPTRSSWPR